MEASRSGPRNNERYGINLPVDDEAKMADPGFPANNDLVEAMEKICDALVVENDKRFPDMTEALNLLTGAAVTMNLLVYRHMLAAGEVK
jgi:hypothetical protein